MSPEECNQSLAWRYATKEFDPSRKIAPDVWDTLINTLVMAPSSFGMELWQFIDVRDPETKNKLRGASWDQSQVTDASHYVMICVRRDVGEEDVDRHVARMCEVRGICPDNLALYKERFMNFYEAKDDAEAVSWVDRQSYIALGFIMLAAASMGIDTCAIEGMIPDECDAILGLEESPYRSLCGIALGYRKDTDKYATTPKVRFAREDVVRVI